MPIPFEHVQNVASGKSLTVGADGLIRQFTFNSRNLEQQWLRLRHVAPSDGTFKFISRISNKVIDARGGQLADHTPLQVFGDHGGRNQRWNIVSTIEDRNVFFIKAADTEKVWDVPDSSSADGVQIQLSQLNGGNNQRWRLRPAEALDNIIKIQSPISRMLLDVPGFSQNDGSFIQQIPDNGGFNQQWSFINLFANTFKIKSVSSGKVLDYPLQSARQNQSAQVSQREDIDGFNQHWQINTIRQNPGGNNIVQFVSRMNGFLLDLPNSSRAVSEHIIVFRGNGGLNQQWQLLRIP